MREVAAGCSSPSSSSQHLSGPRADFGNPTPVSTPISDSGTVSPSVRIPAVATPTHALGHSITPEPLTELTAGILASLVRVEHHFLWLTALFPGAHHVTVDVQLAISPNSSPGGWYRNLSTCFGQLLQN